MHGRLHTRVIAALVAAVIVSGAAQATLLMPCAPAMRVSGCCPGQQHEPGPMVAAQQRQCCEIRSLPSAPAAATRDRLVTSAPLPVPLPHAIDAAIFAPPIERVSHVPCVGPPPPRLTRTLANCALLI